MNSSRATHPQIASRSPVGGSEILSDEVMAYLHAAANSMNTVADLRACMQDFPLHGVRSLVLEALDYFSAPNTLENGKADYEVVLPRRRLGFGRRLKDDWKLMMYRYGAHDPNYPNIFNGVLMWLDRHQAESLREKSVAASCKAQPSTLTTEAIAQKCIRILKRNVMRLE